MDGGRGMREPSVDAGDALSLLIANVDNVSHPPTNVVLFRTGKSEVVSDFQP